MIGESLPRGSSVRGLIYYLFTEGRAGEKGLAASHTDPRVIASWEGDGSGLQPPLCGGRRDFGALIARLNEPVQALGFTAEELRKVKLVYHLTIAVAKDGQTGVLVDPSCRASLIHAPIITVVMSATGTAPKRGIRWVRTCEV